MDNQQYGQDEISQLIENAQHEDTDSNLHNDNDVDNGKTEEVSSNDNKKKNKIFEKYKIKDIVFLAIISACMLVTGAIMPLVTQVPIFGIIEICLGLQFSIFPVIGLMKVRKPGALILMSLFCGIVFAFMFLPMFACIMICAAICELLVLVIFRGYKSDAACVFAGTLYLPLTLPFLYLWYNVIYTINTAEDGKAVQAFVGAEPGFAVGITFAVIAICFVGSLIGMKISREMKKAGVMKK